MHTGTKEKEGVSMSQEIKLSIYTLATLILFFFYMTDIYLQAIHPKVLLNQAQQVNTPQGMMSA